MGDIAREGRSACGSADSSALTPHELHAGVQFTLTQRRSITKTQRHWRTA
jgi:hypothetical protein